MGGSLGLALRRTGRWRVVGWGRRVSTLKRAFRRRAIDEWTRDVPSAAGNASVVIFCVPVPEIIPHVQKWLPHLPTDALVMDVGSVKGSIVRQAKTLFKSNRGPFFVGAHPMAGSEKTGVENARADLYVNATCALTPATGTPTQVLNRARLFWESVGAKTWVLSPSEHDRIVALTSHVPHLVADALMLAVGAAAPSARKRAIFQALSAGSFRDMTRVAGADPVLWQGIFKENAHAVARAAKAFANQLQALVRGQWPLGRLRNAARLNQVFRRGILL